jgi:phage shock protein E
MYSYRRSVTRSFIYTSMILLPLLFCSRVIAADISAQQLLQRLDSNDAPLILDVRRPDEYAAGHVPTATNIPHTELENRLDELHTAPDQEIVVYCESGRRAAIAQDILARAGFSRVLHLQGDMQAWRRHTLPTEGGESGTDR